MQYIIKPIGYNQNEIKNDFKHFFYKVFENLNLYIDIFNNKNKTQKKYDGIGFFITPEDGINTIILSYCIINKLPCYIFFKNIKNNNKNNILSSLKNDYNYSEKKIEFIKKILNDKKYENIIKIITDPMAYNNGLVLWLMDENKRIENEINECKKEKITLYDIYNMDIFS